MSSVQGKNALFRKFILAIALTISGRTDLIVRLGWPLANVFKLLLDQSRQQPRDSSALPKSLLNQSLTKLNVKKLG
jgi:hypothetical protein